MKEKMKFSQVLNNEMNLYSLLGESLCAIQILEDALSHLIVLKSTEPNQKSKADKQLKKQQFYTFGKAIVIAKRESLLTPKLENELSVILKERNWLIHESITNDKDNYKTDSYFNALFERIKVLALNAQRLQIAIELDLITYSENKGIDMTEVKNKMNKNYGFNI